MTTKYEETVKENRNFVNRLLYKEIRKFRDSEDQGYFEDDVLYTEGDAFWWISIQPEDIVVPTKHNQKPVYPNGQWWLVARTTDGHVEYDNSQRVAEILTGLMLKKELNYDHTQTLKEND